MQGFGAVGKHAARFLAQKGAVLVAASDTGGTLADPSGLDVGALIALKEAGRSLHDHDNGSKLAADAILDIDCDIWIPAARPDVVRADNVSRLRTRLMPQGANIPCTPEAEQALHERGVLVVPDFIANAGGVICASMEYRGGTQRAAFDYIDERIRANVRVGPGREPTSQDASARCGRRAGRTPGASSHENAALALNIKTWLSTGSSQVLSAEHERERNCHESTHHPARQDPRNSIGLDYSWFVIFALLTWMLAGSYYPEEFKHWSPLLYWLMGAITAIMLFVSVLLHELGHSVVALRYKIPVRSITLFLFGGVAQIGAEPPSAIAEFFIAVAGPLVSLALAILFYAAQPLIGGMEPLLGLAKYLAYINLALVLFNLIPGYPLDGGRVLRAIVWAITGNMDAVDPHRSERRSVFCLLADLCWCLADVQRQFWWWALGCVHRLVPRQRGFRPDRAGDVSGSADGASRFASHEYALRRYFRKV